MPARDAGQQNAPNRRFRAARLVLEDQARPVSVDREHLGGAAVETLGGIVFVGEPHAAPGPKIPVPHL